MLLDSPLPEKLYTALQVREIDRTVIEDYGVSGFELMQKAARFTFHVLVKRWPESKRVCVICGSGNNAGDGYLIAAIAKKHCLDVEILSLSDPEKLKGDALLAYQYSQEQGVEHQSFSTQYWAQQYCPMRHNDNEGLVIVDAMLGTGINADVRDNYLEAIKLCNKSEAAVLAVDIPSGLSADTGQAIGTSIKADATATFIGLKIGLFTGSGQKYCGKLYFDDLDVPKELDKRINCIANKLNIKTLLSKVKPRFANTHKGHYGHVLLIGGDHGYGGAIIMAAEAAARTGAGLVSVATQPEHCSTLLSRRPEVMVNGVSSIDQLKTLLKNASVLVVGPGLGKSTWSKQILATALERSIPTILDADALTLICQNPDWHPQNRHHLIMTPHPGEAARLLECTSVEVQNDRLTAVKRIQEKWGGSIILKGSGSLIAHTNQAMKLCPYGNPGMATGGMGDVLSGILGGLVAQEFDQDEAIELAVCLHAAAADIAAGESGQRGLLAADLIPIMRQLLNGFNLQF